MCGTWWQRLIEAMMFWRRKREEESTDKAGQMRDRIRSAKRDLEERSK